MKLYLSGSITAKGGGDAAKSTFQSQASRLRVRGYEVISPLDYPDANEIGWVTCMQRDIGLVAQCDGVAVIDDSPLTQHSHGVAIELEVAQYLGMPVMSVASWMLADIESDEDMRVWRMAERVSAASRRLISDDDDKKKTEDTDADAKLHVPPMTKALRDREGI